MINVNAVEISLLIDALAKAASRHETQARSVKFGRRHDEKAAAMRELRAKLMRDRIEATRRRSLALTYNSPVQA